MNETAVYCFTHQLQFSYLTSRQLATLTVFNLMLMPTNIIANALVMYVLIKTKQISTITCKVIFMLSLSDLLQGIFAQNLFTAAGYEKSCLLVKIHIFVFAFLMHLSGYMIAIIGVDRYLRIKYYAKFKVIWSAKIVLIFICFGSFLALFQAVMITVGLILELDRFVVPVYVTMDVVIIGIIIILQVKTIRTSRNAHNTSTVAISERINKKVTKLSMRIMLLLCFFFAPHTIILNIIRSIIKHQLNSNEKSVLEFIASISLMFAFANCFANATLFLVTNVKAKRFLRDFAGL